jgi:hypothetical protein
VAEIAHGHLGGEALRRGSFSSSCRG